MFYEMVALCVNGKVLNYFRHYATTATVDNFDFNLKFHLQVILMMGQ